jgi:hypothetical protein
VLRKILHRLDLIPGRGAMDIEAVLRPRHVNRDGPRRTCRVCLNERRVDGPLLQHAAHDGAVAIGTNTCKEIGVPPGGCKVYCDMQRGAGDDTLTGEFVDYDFPEADSSRAGY